MSSYWNQKMSGRARVMTALAAAILIPVYFVPVLPVWMIHLRAPQYMEGLELKIYTNDVRGDLQNINILNHYVGMKEIKAEDFREFRFMPGLLSGFGLWALVAALWGRRWFAALGWGLFSLSSILLVADFGYWLYKYGNELDPRAALKLDAFTPPLIGFKKMGNFQVGSFPHVGGVLLLIAGLLGPVMAFLEWRGARRASRDGVSLGARAASAAVGLGLVSLLSTATPTTIRAAVHEVPSSVAALQLALETSADGDTLRLAPVTYEGTFVVTRPLTIQGRPGTVLDGNRSGTVLTGTTGGIVVEDLVIRGSGTLLLDDDAGVHLLNAPGSRIERVAFEDNLHGVYLERCAGTVLRDLTFHGRSGEVSEGNNGNAIHLWYSPDVLIESVEGARHRDGAYVSFCERVTFRGCRFHHSDRYGLHYMYSQENAIEGCTFDHNVAGAAIMFSNHLVVTGNRFVENDDPRAYGLLLRDCSDGRFERNRFEGNTVAVFLDNSHRNRFASNRVHDNAWGFYVYASSVDNAFVRNDVTDVTYPLALDQRTTSNVFSENYWSGSESFDLDGDRRGDRPYHPVGLFAFLSKRYPDLALFAESPAVAAIATAERLLPALSGSEVADSLPAMRPWGAAATVTSEPLGSSRRGGSLPLAVGAGALLMGGGGLLWRLRRS